MPGQSAAEGSDMDEQLKGKGEQVTGKIHEIAGQAKSNVR